jgi:hypothetical protein
MQQANISFYSLTKPKKKTLSYRRCAAHPDDSSGSSIIGLGDSRA